ncbi:cysteine proteinase [Phanerochaete sordida]|uniref:Cysteine proteinase n=1 Tax=Phanerochaete sordida TaxID=48140 RepID=A0A9P3GRZ3_9APHY|nr:cysteine proteinase [Phanerochaete sordida]
MMFERYSLSVALRSRCGLAWHCALAYLFRSQTSYRNLRSPSAVANLSTMAAGSWNKPSQLSNLRQYTAAERRALGLPEPISYAQPSPVPYGPRTQAAQRLIDRLRKIKTEKSNTDSDARSCSSPERDDAGGNVPCPAPSSKHRVQPVQSSASAPSSSAEVVALEPLSSSPDTSAVLSVTSTETAAVHPIIDEPAWPEPTQPSSAPGIHAEDLISIERLDYPVAGAVAPEVNVAQDAPNISVTRHCTHENVIEKRADDSDVEMAESHPDAKPLEAFAREADVNLTEVGPSKLPSSTTSGEDAIPIGDAKKIGKADRVRKASKGTTAPRKSDRIQGLDPEFGNPKLCDVHFPTIRNALTIQQSDRARLLPRVWLNDTIMEFALRTWYHELPTPIQEQTLLLNTFFFSFLCEAPWDEAFDKARRQFPRRMNIFEMKYIVVPVHVKEENHWYMVIVTDPARLIYPADDRDPEGVVRTWPVYCGRRGFSRAGLAPMGWAFELKHGLNVLVRCPTIWVMDSRYPSPQARGLQQTLKQQHTKEGKQFAKEMELHLGPDHDDGLPRRLIGRGQDPSLLISRFLYAEAARQGYKMFSPYTAFELQVPRQENDYDCGVYAIQFATQFMRNPQEAMNLPLCSDLRTFDWACGDISATRKAWLRRVDSFVRSNATAHKA